MVRKEGWPMPRVGRPREFVETDVLDAAVALFWKNGYEATSMTMLLEAMGLSSASFYGAFGSKRGIFEAALGRYHATFGQMTATLGDASLSARSALERHLRESVLMQTDPSHPLGCLIALSGTNVAPDSDCTVSRDYRNATRSYFTACVERAIAEGQFRADIEVEGFATLLECIYWGIATDARDGVSRANLLAAVDRVMDLWDVHAARVART